MRWQQGLCPGTRWEAHDAPQIAVGWGADTSHTPPNRRLDLRAFATCPCLEVFQKY